MLLQNSFYSLDSIQLNDQQLEAVITIDPKHAIFDGHFPNNPVTPGVVQMEIVKEILSTQFERNIQLKTLSNCKFLSILNPNETPKVKVNLSLTQNEDNTFRVSGQLTTERGSCFKISATYY